MPRLLKDERKVMQAQRIYDESVDNWLKMMDELNSNIMEIYDIISGYANGKKEEKYQLTPQQYSALKDQFNLWKSNLREPDKTIENIDNELRKKHKRRQAQTETNTEPKQKPVAQDATPRVAVFKLKAD